MNTNNNNQHDQQQQQQHSHQHHNIQCKPISSSSHHHKNHHLFVQSMKQLFPTTTTTTSTHHHHAPPQASSSSLPISTTTTTTTPPITHNNNNMETALDGNNDEEDDNDLVIHVVQETRLTDPNPFFHTYGGTRNSHHIHSRSSPPTTPPTTTTPPLPFSSSSSSPAAAATKSILVPLKISNNYNNNYNNNTHKESSIISSTTRIPENRKRKWMTTNCNRSDESVHVHYHHHGSSSSSSTSSNSSIMPHFVKRRMIEQQQKKSDDHVNNEMTMIVLDDDDDDENDDENDDEKEEKHQSDQTIKMTTTTPQEKQVLNERKLSDFSLNDDPLLEIVMKHSKPKKTFQNDTRVVSNVASLTRHNNGSQSQKGSSSHHDYHDYHHGGMMTGSNDVKSSRNSGNSSGGSHVVEPGYVKLDQNMAQRYAVILMGDQWMTLLDQITYQSIGNDGEELVVMSIDRMRLSHSVVRSGETRFCEIQMRRRHMSDPWTLTVDRQMFFGFKILKNNIIDDDELLKHRLEDDRCVDIIIVGNAHRPTRFFIQSQSNTNCYTLADMEQTANHSLRMLQAAGYLKRSGSDDTNEKTPLSNSTNSVTATTASSTLEIITKKPVTGSSHQNSSTTGSQNTPSQTSSQTPPTSSSSMPSKAKTISDAQEEDEEEFDFNYDDLIDTKAPVKSSTRSSSRMNNSPSMNTRSNAKHQMEIIDDEDVVPVKSIPKPKLTPKEAAEPLLRLYNITITKGDLARLEPGEYLNDNIVDFYYQFINESKFAMSKHHFHIFNSHFYPLLLKDAARAAKRVPEPDKVKIFECDWLFIPMCENEHWTLAVVTSLPRLKERIEDHMAGIVSIDGDPSPDDPLIFICDSLNLVDREQQHKITHLIRHYLSQRYMIEYGNASSGTTQLTYSITRRDLKLHRSTVPQQSNYCDCGVYMLEYTDRLLTERYRHANRGLDESVLEMTEDCEKPNFELPFQNRKWFPSRDIKNKRKYIKQTILDKISDLGPALPSISMGSTLGDSLQMLSQDPTASPLLRDKTQSSDGCNTTSEDTKGDTETIGIKDSQQTKSSEEQENDVNESPTSPRIEISPCSPSDTPISHGDKKAPGYDFTPSPELF